MRIVGLFVLASTAVAAPLAQEPPEGLSAYQFGLYWRVADREEIAQEKEAAIQRAHLEHLGNLAKSGLLLAAGPIGDDGDLRGILIFKNAPLEEIRAAADKDPAIRNRRLRLEIHPWWGQEGIGERVSAMLKENPQAEFSMKAYQLGILSKGGKWTRDSTPEEAALQERHVANVWAMLNGGELALAGPFRDDGEFRGIFVFQLDSIEMAQSLAAQDPSVAAERMKVEFHPLWMAEEVIPIKKSTKH